MGGLIILSSIVITSLFYMKDYPRIIPVLFMTVGFGIIGFLDDYIKIVMKRFRGAESETEASGPDRDHRDLRLLSDDLRGGRNGNADPLHRRL